MVSYCLPLVCFPTSTLRIAISRGRFSAILTYNLYSVKQITGSWFHITLVTESGTDCPLRWHQLIKANLTPTWQRWQEMLRQCLHVLMSPLKDNGCVNSGILFPCCLFEFLMPIPWIVSSAMPCTVWVLVRASKRPILTNTAVRCLYFTVPPSPYSLFLPLPLSFRPLGLPLSSFPIYWSSPLGK